jgi:CHASE2 domain
MGTARDKHVAGTRPAPPRPRLTWMGLATLGIVLPTVLAYREGRFDELDAMARSVEAHVSKARPPGDIVIVSITDTDYREMFQEVSPLNPDSVRRLLAAIAAGDPRIIGVDLDTSDPAWLKVSIPEEWPIVWGRGASCRNPCADDDDIQLRGVLGRQPPTVRSGLTALEEDRHHNVRSYRRVFGTMAGPSSAFAWLLSRADSGEVALAPDSPRSASPSLLIDFRFGSPWRYSAREILTAPKGVLRHKFVLLGGTFEYGRDRHDTPLGPMSGLEIHAQVLAAHRRDPSAGAVPPPAPTESPPVYRPGRTGGRSGLQLARHRFSHRRNSLLRAAASPHCGAAVPREVGSARRGPGERVGCARERHSRDGGVDRPHGRSRRLEPATLGCLDGTCRRETPTVASQTE